MPTLSSVLRLLSSALCLLVISVHAQPAAPTPAPPKLRFLFLDESVGEYSLGLDPAHHRFTTNPYEISAPFIPADFKPLDVYKTLPDPVTGVPKPVKIASVTPPDDTPSALVIITPRPPASADVDPVYQIELIDTNPTLFPAGSIRIINRSPISMTAQFGDTRSIAAPGEVKLVQPSTDSRRRIPFRISIQNQPDSESWQLIQDSITVIRANERMFGILVYSPGGMKHMLTASEIAEMGQPKPGCFWLTFSDTP